MLKFNLELNVVIFLAPGVWADLISYTCHCDPEETVFPSGREEMAVWEVRS